MPKSASPKKTAGTPKAKGAVRAKSGCYTCRIRRKKCDERPDELGRCETCVRLRLQCLGFGAKRPEWLRENNNVTDLREKIKNFLASQGMIKGHSGTGSRSVEQEQTLRLADEQYNTPSESPPSNILVLDEESPRGTMSNIREHREPELEPELYSSTSYGASSSASYDTSPSHIFSHSPDSTFLRLSTPTYAHPHQQDSIEGYPNDYYLTSNHTNVVVPWNNPTRHSSFGPSYHLPFDVLDGFDNDDLAYSPFDLNLGIDETDSLLQHYMDTVYRHQYQLADMKKLPKIIFQSIMEGGIARNAAVLLAGIHKKKLGNNEHFLLVRDGPSKDRYDKLVLSLRPPSQQRRVYNESDAMAALHIISAFLFDGGRGEWQMWMQVAYWYCRSILEDRQRFRDYRDALVSCTVHENFIIKTFFWFDVLASVSTMQPPLFQKVLNEIYNPVEQISRIEDPADIYTEPALSMMTAMGCENRIVWALSEISALACWKRTQEGIGMLSVVELVRRATILNDLLVPSMDLRHIQQQQTTGVSENAEPEEPARYLASEIFRTAAIAYLQTIVNNDFYEVPEVQRAVKDCVEAFKSFRDYKMDVRHIVVRSTVFAVFLCGCFTDIPDDWDALETHLKEEGSMGNCKDVMELIQEVRAERGQPKPHPVMWRQVLKRAKMLLV